MGWFGKKYRPYAKIVKSEFEKAEQKIANRMFKEYQARAIKRARQGYCSLFIYHSVHLGGRSKYGNITQNVLDRLAIQLDKAGFTVEDCEVSDGDFKNYCVQFSWASDDAQTKGE